MNKQELMDSLKSDGYSLESESFKMSYGGIARALFPDVEWFFDKQEGSYSGDWYMVGKDASGKYYFFTMGYGSCSGCDWMESALSNDADEAKKELGEIVDKILGTPVLRDKEAAIEYAKKFDWQNDYDRDEHNPIVKEVLEAIEKS